MAKGVDRRVLYVALLLHDIGKGSGRDHSAVGAEVAERLCPRFGLDDEETELVVWLVQNHLLMSDVAQKRDLAEPRTVRDFAQAVKSPTRLKLLTVLTVCDIRGVGPGVWNNWKAMLLRGLYARDAGVPDRRQPGGEPARARGGGPRGAGRGARPTGREAEIAAECARHYAPYWLGFDTRTHAIFADLVRQLAEAEPAMQIELDLERDATQACFAMSDHPGIFARLAGALALAGGNVVDARTYTTTDGIATAAFWIQDAEGKPYEKRAADPAAQRRHPDAQGRDRRPRGAEGQGQDQASASATSWCRPGSASTTPARTSTPSSRSRPATGRACSTTSPAR